MLKYAFQRNGKIKFDCFENIDLNCNIFENLLWDSKSEIPMQLIETKLAPNNMLNPAHYNSFNYILGDNWKIILWK